MLPVHTMSGSSVARQARSALRWRDQRIGPRSSTRESAGSTRRAEAASALSSVSLFLAAGIGAGKQILPRGGIWGHPSGKSTQRGVVIVDLPAHVQDNG